MAGTIAEWHDTQFFAGCTVPRFAEWHPPAQLFVAVCVATLNPWLPSTLSAWQLAHSRLAGVPFQWQTWQLVRVLPPSVAEAFLWVSARLCDPVAGWQPES
jgi:hypothetical protein